MKIFNFSAGPACLPSDVLKAASKASLDYKKTGISLMEMSHRSIDVMNLFDEATKRVKELLNLPSNYHPLWLQGGASSQFSMVPLNLLPVNGVADYIETGSWSTKAIKECRIVGNVNISGTSKETNFNHIQKFLVKIKILPIYTLRAIIQFMELNFINFQFLSKQKAI